MTSVALIFASATSSFRCELIAMLYYAELGPVLEESALMNDTRRMKRR